MSATSIEPWLLNAWADTLRQVVGAVSNRNIYLPECLYKICLLEGGPLYPETLRRHVLPHLRQNPPALAPIAKLHCVKATQRPEMSSHVSASSQEPNPQQSSPRQRRDPSVFSGIAAEAESLNNDEQCLRHEECLKGRMQKQPDSVQDCRRFA